MASKRNVPSIGHSVPISTPETAVPSPSKLLNARPGSAGNRNAGKKTSASTFSRAKAPVSAGSTSRNPTVPKKARTPTVASSCNGMMQPNLVAIPRKTHSTESTASSAVCKRVKVLPDIAPKTNPTVPLKDPKGSSRAGDFRVSKPCNICAEKRSLSEMIRINKTCSHSFCTTCVSKHIKTRVLDNQVNVPCPGIDCKHKVEYESCIGFIPRDVLEAWDRAHCESLILDTYKLYCPFRDCSAMLVNDLEKAIQQCECPHCHRLFCAHCRVPWHASVSCLEYQALNKDEKGNADLLVKKLADENKWGRCPECKYYVERTGGCAHIKCRCKFEFCYGCGKPWTDSHGGCARN